MRTIVQRFQDRANCIAASFRSALEGISVYTEDDGDFAGRIEVDMKIRKDGDGSENEAERRLRAFMARFGAVLLHARTAFETDGGVTRTLAVNWR